MTDFETDLRAGVAIYNDGHYHAAHDAWEDRWLELPADSPDERLLHGLIQFTAAIHHARRQNWAGSVGLADSAADYLADLGTAHRGVRLPPVRQYSRSLAADPEVIERSQPPLIQLEGATPGLYDVDVETIAVAAPILAEEYGFTVDPIEAAAQFALADLEAGQDDSRFIALLFDFAADDTHRATVFDRLASHVDRRRSRDASVDDLFDP